MAIFLNIFTRPRQEQSRLRLQKTLFLIFAVVNKTKKDALHFSQGATKRMGYILLFSFGKR